MKSIAAIVALLAAISCSENETFPEPGTDPAGGVALGVTTGVLNTHTRAVVEGEAVTYTEADYTTAAKGLGIVIVKKDDSGIYEPNNKTEYTATTPVWFMGDALGKTWKAVSALGTDFATAPGKPYYLTEEVGVVYAYYPYTATFSGTQSADLAIDCAIQKTAAIKIDESTVNNADMTWDDTNKKWVSNTAAKGTSNRVIANGDETDYLYFDGTERYVNNGRATLTEPAGNGDETNPGYTIALNMAHALSMVSFRIYNDGTLDGAGLFTKFEIKNATGKTVLQTTGSAKMKLADGTISGLSAGGVSDVVARTIEGYTIPKEVKMNDEQDANHYLVAGTGSSAVTGAKVCKKVSTLVYPVAVIGDGDLLAVITIDGKEYTVNIPSDAGAWAAGSNYLYTIRASRRALDITEVTVTPWATESGGDIDI